MVWREPRNHADDCYFCLTNITGFNASSRKKIKYLNLRSAMRPVPHSDDLPVPTPPINKEILSSSDEEMLSREDSAESILLEDIESTYSRTSDNEPYWITQEDLNDLAHDLYPSKQQSELLASRFKQWNLVQEDVRITSFRNRNKDLASFFDMENKLCYCTNINGLFTSLGLPHNPSDWGLFIDSSKRSLKGILLHNGNKYPSIPIAFSVHLKESYNNMELLLEAMKYSEYQWSLCGDLKVIGLLMSMQAGFTKYCCFLCLWDSRAVSQHYKQTDWGSRSTFVPGEHSLKENPLVDMNKVLLPPLHIKLGLMKNFVKALHKNGAAFQHLSTAFPGLSAAKLKEGIFVGPQIREVMNDTDFEENITDEKTYIGLASTKWKERYFNHKFTFSHEHLKNHMALSKQVWFLKNKGLNPDIEWSILKKSNTPNSFNGGCSLCLEEKISILTHKWPDKLLNKRSELIARCRNKTKFKL